MPSALAGAWTCRGGAGGGQTAEVPFLLSQVRLFAELHFLYSSHNCLSPPLFAERPFVYLGGWGAEWPCLICRARRFLLIGDAFVSIIPRDPSPSVGHLAPWRRPRGGAGLGRRSSCRGVGVSRVTSEQGLAPHRLAQPVGLSAAPGGHDGALAARRQMARLPVRVFSSSPRLAARSHLPLDPPRAFQIEGVWSVITSRSYLGAPGRVELGTSSSSLADLQNMLVPSMA